jgi:NADPH:quinone reductase-like Zn-dependent oxidoreductase
MSPTTTSAIVIERHGPPEALAQREMPLRDPGVNDVHLRVGAVGVNFADLFIRAGLYPAIPPRPFSPGIEVVGTVARVGKKVKGWEEGDRAIALVRHGGYVRDLVVPAERLFHYPDSIRPEQAAAIPVVFLTAWLCLFEAGRARRGETVLVLGAGGGVGTAAVQLAVRHGLRVIGTAGDPRKREFVTEELGGEVCFDSRGDWEPEVRGLVGPSGIDLALDPIGGPATAACRRLLAPLGRLIFYGFSNAMPGRRLSRLRAARAWMRTPRFHPISLLEPPVGVFGVALFNLGEKAPILQSTLGEVFRAVVDGELHAVVDRVFPFDRDGAVEAHTYLHERRNLGKVVLADPAVSSSS